MLKILDCIYYIRKEKFYLVRIHLNFDFLLASFLSYFCSLLPSFFSFFFFILFTFPSLSIPSSFFVFLFLASASFLFRSPLPRFFSFSLFYSFLFFIIFGFFFLFLSFPGFLLPCGTSPRFYGLHIRFSPIPFLPADPSSSLLTHPSCRHILFRADTSYFLPTHPAKSSSFLLAHPPSCRLILLPSDRIFLPAHPSFSLPIYPSVCQPIPLPAAPSSSISRHPPSLRSHQGRRDALHDFPSLNFSFCKRGKSFLDSNHRGKPFTRSPRLDLYFRKHDGIFSLGFTCHWASPITINAHTICIRDAKDKIVSREILNHCGFSVRHYQFEY